MAQWDNLSDGAFDEIAGRREQLIVRIQEAYGVSQEEADQQIADFEKANEAYRPPSGS